MEKKKRRNGMSKRAKIITLVLCVAVVGGLGWFLLKPTKTAASVTYTKYQAKTGNIETTVFGSGSISSTQTLPYNALAAGVGKQVVASNGATVARGDLIAVISADASDSRQLSMVADAMTEDYMSLTKLYTYSSGTTKVMSPVAGRVKLLAVSEGDDVSIAQQKGALLVISSDGDMYVDFMPKDNTSLELDQKVKVEIDGKKVSGKVVRTASQGLARVLISSDIYDQGTDVKITDSSGNEIGEGKLMINAPVPVVATGGYVDSLSVKENSKVSKGSTLMRLVQAGLDDGYSGALAVVAPADGFISDLALTNGGSIQANALMFNLLSSNTFTLTVSVDELDIADIKPGQSASITIDAIKNKTFKGTVLRASAVGTSSGGVATYDVAISLNDTAGVLPGMSASANIQTAHKENVVVVPASAVISRGSKKYVMLASAVSQTGTANNSTFNTSDYIEVETGITDGTNIEITSGLTSGTEIAYRQSASSTSGSNRNGFVMDMGGGTAPRQNFNGGGQQRPGGNGQ